MLRRLCALILAITCACAPAFASLADVSATDDSCCCEQRCPCPMTDCAPPPAAPQAGASLRNSALEQRAAATKPALRIARAAFTYFLSSETDRAVSLRPSMVDAATPAVSVGLLQAHCSLLL